MKKALYITIIGLIIISPIIMAAKEMIGGTGVNGPLKVAVDDDLSMEFYHEDYAHNQYYSTTSKGSVFYYTDDATPLKFGSAYYSPDASISSFSTSSNTISGDTITTTITTTNAIIIQKTTYTAGANKYSITWNITNTGSNEFTNLLWGHGGDTFFAGADSAESYFSPSLQMVYLRNPTSTSAIMGIYGTSQTPISNYYAGDYGYSDGGRGWLIAGTNSNFTLGDSTDAGYYVQWRKDSLLPGETWMIYAEEQITESGSVQVLAPASQTPTGSGDIEYLFNVLNYETETTNMSIDVTSSAGWDITANATNLIMASGATDTVKVTLSVPDDVSDGDSDILTLNASSNNSNSAANTVSTTADLPIAITIHSPIASTYTNTNNISLNVSSSEEANAWWYSLNDEANSTFIPNTTISSLDDAEYTLTVYANDSSGNIGYREVTFTVDYVQEYTFNDPPAGWGIFNTSDAVLVSGLDEFTTNQTIILTKNSEKFLEIVAILDQGNTSFVNLVLDGKNNEDKKYSVVDLSSVTGQDNLATAGHSLFVKNDWGNGIFVCPDAKTESAVTSSCSNKVTFSHSECAASTTTDSITCSIDGDYYKASGLSGTGIMAQGNAQLVINDSVEGSSVNTNTDIIFHAYYTNSTGDNHISSATCEIKFDDAGTWFLMNEETNKYNYTKSGGFSSGGSHTWEVNCSATSFTTIDTTDSVSVIAPGAQSVSVPFFPGFSEIMTVFLCGGILFVVLRKERF